MMSDKELCSCGEIATWTYMPGSGSYCDYRVPRGCSCNWYPDSEELVEEKDEYGRSYPCCEYLYEAAGFDK